MKMPRCCTGRRTGPAAFTLVELLVVIAIIGTLVGLLLPAVQAAREAARRSTCGNNARQVALAAANFSEARGHYPYEGGAVGLSNFSWLCYVLPFMEQQDVYDQFGAGYPTPTQAYNNRFSMGRFRIPSLQCPSARFTRSGSSGDAPGGGFAGNAWTTHYYGNAGPFGTNPATLQNPGYKWNQIPSGNTQGGLACDGIIVHASKVITAAADAAPVRPKDVVDGTSKTLMLLEISWDGVQASFRSWLKGTQFQGSAGAHRNVRYGMRLAAYTGANFNVTGMGSNHPGGCSVVFADCSVRFLSEMVDTNTVLIPLASRAGSETVSADRY